MTTRRGFLGILGLAAAAPIAMTVAKLAPKKPILGAYWNDEAGIATGIATDTHDNGYVIKTYYYSDYTTRSVRYKPNGELDLYYGIKSGTYPQRHL